ARPVRHEAGRGGAAVLLQPARAGDVRRLRPRRPRPGPRVRCRRRGRLLRRRRDRPGLGSQPRARLHRVHHCDRHGGGTRVTGPATPPSGGPSHASADGPPAGGAGAPVLAVDIGGTKLAAALVEPDGRVSAYDRVATLGGADVGAEELWRVLEGLLDTLVSDAGDPPLAGVGTGCGGPMTWPAAEVSPLNIPAWRNGFPLRARLRDQIGRASCRE